jgi:hypothetical protein
MRPLTHTVRLAVALAMLMPGLIMLWMLAMPGTLGQPGYVLAAGLITALMTVAMISYKNAHAAGSVAELLHGTGMATAAATAGPRRSPRSARPPG